MPHNRRALARILGLTVTFLVLLQRAPVQAADSEPLPQTSDAPDTAHINTLVSVNGTMIGRERFNAAFERVSAFSSAADADALALDVLHRLIYDELILQFAVENQIAVAAEQIDAEIAKLINGMSAAAWEIWLADNQYTAGEFRDALKLHHITLAVRAHVTAHLHDEVAHVRARHILVAKRGEAQRAIERLRAGEGFGALAATLSLDASTRDFGGDLGWFIRGELLDARLNEAAFSQAVGEIGSPVATRLGYHVLQVIGRSQRFIEPARLPRLIEVVFDLWLANQFEAAHIHFNLNALDALVQTNS